ncbi:MAG: element excision factor XisI family protein [Bacteroidota bacterium]
MDKLLKRRQILREFLEKKQGFPSKEYPLLHDIISIDAAEHFYLQTTIGWDEGVHVCEINYHLELKDDGRIWIHEFKGDIDFSEYLLDYGIPNTEVFFMVYKNQKEMEQLEEMNKIKPLLDHSDNPIHRLYERKLILKNFLSKEREKYERNDLTTSLTIDQDEQHYVLSELGWHQGTFRYLTLYHFELKTNGQIWIHENRTDADISDYFWEMGLPHSDLFFSQSLEAKTQYQNKKNKIIS